MTKPDEQDLARMIERLHKVYSNFVEDFEASEAVTLMRELHQMEAHLGPDDQKEANWFHSEMVSGSALLNAAGSGDVEEVRIRLDAGAPINYRHWSGGSPLDEAVRMGKDPVVKLLVDRGVDSNLTDKQGRTALMFAAAPSTTRILLAAGADVNAQDEHGQTALHYRATNSSSESIQLLLDAGADTTLVDRQGFTAEDVACKEVKPALVAHREQGILRQVAGLDANQDEPVQRHRKM